MHELSYGGRGVAGFGIGAGASGTLGDAGCADMPPELQAKCQANNSKEAQDQRAQQLPGDIGTISDYVKNPPNLLTMTHEQIRARNEAFRDATARTGAAAVSLVLTPAAGALFMTLYGLVSPALNWLADNIGFNDPIPHDDRILFESRCDPNNQDIKDYWPNGIPTGIDDPNWVKDPAAHPTYAGSMPMCGDFSGAGSRVRLTSPPFDINAYDWSDGMQPGAGKFEDFAFGMLVQNAINEWNCAPSLQPDKLLEQLIVIWNSTHDFPLRRIDISSPPAWSYGANGRNCGHNGPGPGECWPPMWAGNTGDPVTQAWRNGQYDLSAYCIDAKDQWKGRSFFEIKDGPSLPYCATHPSDLLCKGGSQYHGGGGGIMPIELTSPVTATTTAKPGMSTGAKVAIGVGVVGASAAAYSYFTHGIVRRLIRGG